MHHDAHKTSQKYDVNPYHHIDSIDLWSLCAANHWSTLLGTGRCSFFHSERSTASTSTDGSYRHHRSVISASYPSYFIISLSENITSTRWVDSLEQHLWVQLNRWDVPVKPEHGPAWKCPWNATIHQAVLHNMRHAIVTSLKKVLQMQRQRWQNHHAAKYKISGWAAQLLVLLTCQSSKRLEALSTGHNRVCHMATRTRGHAQHRWSAT